MSLDLSTLPAPAVGALGVALLLQLSLAAISLVVLARTPSERILFERKWPWALVIVMVSLVGAILFLAIGRRPVPAPEAPIDTRASGNVTRTVQSLYGDDQL